MDFGPVQKLSDGRRVVRISGYQRQFNALELSSPLSPSPAKFKVSDATLFMEADQELLARAKGSKREWFLKELSDETIEHAFQESVVDAHLESVTVDQNRTLVFDTRKRAVPLAEVKPGTKMDVILELTSLQFLKNSFSPQWRLVQGRVASKGSEFPKSYAFTDQVPESEDESENNIQ